MNGRKRNESEPWKERSSEGNGVDRQQVGGSQVGGDWERASCRMKVSGGKSGILRGMGWTGR